MTDLQDRPETPAEAVTETIEVPEAPEVSDAPEAPVLPEATSAPSADPAPRVRPARMLGFLLCALIGGLLGGAGAGFYFSAVLPNSPNPELPFRQWVPPAFDVSRIASSAMDSVAAITVRSAERNATGQIGLYEGFGTGVIVHGDGYVLTNAHVVEKGTAARIAVLLHDGRELAGRLLWMDAALDLAILQIPAQNLKPIVLGNSDTLTIGQPVVAIGTPIDISFNNTVTAGIISGLNRRLELDANSSIEGLIQTDATINPGNSGGPLLDRDGAMIGINTVKLTSGEGLSFAIPINSARSILKELIEKGEFRKVQLGVKAVNAQDYAYMEQVELPTLRGVYILDTYGGSAAEKAGLQSGDILTGLEGRDIRTTADLQEALFSRRPGDSVELRINRGGTVLRIPVILD